MKLDLWFLRIAGFLDGVIN